MKSLLQPGSIIALCLLLITNSLNAKFIEVKDNLPLQQQIKTPNSTYVLTGRYKLTGNCVIPSNCQLIFEGGVIEGPFSLTGNNTYINASPYRIFLDDIKLDGTWVNSTCYAEWFGAKGDGVSDDRQALQKALEAKIPVLELLPKPYVIGSYGDVKNKIGLRVPTKKTVIGHAVDDWSKEYTLNAKEGVPFNVLVQICGVHVTLQGIGIFGARNRNYDSYKVKDCISTLMDKFYTGLHLKYVFASGCKENGINLYTYNTRLENCYVTNCDVAYYIHGGNGRGTSVHMLMCTAERARKNAYKLSKISYSVLEVCAADHCSLGTTTNTHNIGDEFGYNYYYEDCRGISEISCAHEAGGFSHYLSDCRGVSIKTSRYTNDGIRDYKDWNDTLASKLWIIKASHNISISQTTIASPLTKGISCLTVDNNTDNVIVEQCFYVDNNSRFEPITEAGFKNGFNRIIIR